MIVCEVCGEEEPIARIMIGEKQTLIGLRLNASTKDLVLDLKNGPVSEKWLIVCMLHQETRMPQIRNA